MLVKLKLIILVNPFLLYTLPAKTHGIQYISPCIHKEFVFVIANLKGGPREEWGPLFQAHFVPLKIHPPTKGPLAGPPFELGPGRSLIRSHPSLRHLDGRYIKNLEKSKN